MAKECLTGEYGTCLPSCDGKRRRPTIWLTGQAGAQVIGAGHLSSDHDRKPCSTQRVASRRKRWERPSMGFDWDRAWSCRSRGLALAQSRSVKAHGMERM
jgi:hypothetical protein